MSSTLLMRYIRYGFVLFAGDPDFVAAFLYSLTSSKTVSLRLSFLKPFTAFSRSFEAL